MDVIWEAVAQVRDSIDLFPDIQPELIDFSQATSDGGFGNPAWDATIARRFLPQPQGGGLHQQGIASMLHDSETNPRMANLALQRIEGGGDGFHETA